MHDFAKDYRDFIFHYFGNTTAGHSVRNVAHAIIGPLAALGFLRTAGGSIVGQLALYGELAAVEWAIEKARLVNVVAMSLLAFACGFCVLLMTGALALALTWNTPYRLMAALIILGAYFLATLAALYRLRLAAIQGGQSFAQTRAQMAADIAQLKDAL
jgi:uncharacterized membrane protein YqjE